VSFSAAPAVSNSHPPHCAGRRLDELVGPLSNLAASFSPLDTCLVLLPPFLNSFFPWTEGFMLCSVKKRAFLSAGLILDVQFLHYSILIYKKATYTLPNFKEWSMAVKNDERVLKIKKNQ